MSNNVGNNLMSCGCLMMLVPVLALFVFVLIIAALGH